MIGIALSDEERLKRLRGAPLSPMPTPAPQPIKREKGAGEQMMDIASEKAMTKASDTFIEPMIDKGISKGVELAGAGADKIAGAFKLAPTKAAAQKAALSMGPGGVGGGVAAGTSALTPTAAAVAPGTAGTGLSSLGSLFGMGGSGAATAGAGAAGTGTMAAMMASPLAPIALGLLAGKAFKLFSEGGKVGPLYSAEGEKVDAAQTVLDNILKQQKKKKANKDKSFFDMLAGSEAIDYKANGGMTGFRSANPNAQPAYATGFRRMPTALAPIAPGRQQTKNFAIAIPTYNPYVAPSAAPLVSSSNDDNGGDTVEGTPHYQVGNTGEFTTTGYSSKSQQHKSWTGGPHQDSNPDSSPSSGCFLTTAIVNRRNEADDGITLTKLRAFRDSFMGGKESDDLKEYYLIAPIIVSKIPQDHSDWDWIESQIDLAVSKIDNDDNISAYNIYKSMVLKLKENWLEE